MNYATIRMRLSRFSSAVYVWLRKSNYIQYELQPGDRRGQRAFLRGVRLVRLGATQFRTRGAASLMLSLRATQTHYRRAFPFGSASPKTLSKGSLKGPPLGRGRFAGKRANRSRRSCRRY